MEFAQWGPLVGAIVAAIGVSWSVYQVSNRASIAHRRASGALSLLKSWNETELGEEDHGDVRAKQSLRRELVEHAFRSTQIYVSSTKPKLTSYWQPILFLVCGGLCIWAFDKSGDPGNPWIVASFVGVLLAMFVSFIVMVLRVSRHHEDADALKSSRKRRAVYVKAKAKQSLREKRNKAVVNVGSEHGQTGEEG
ncbi:hypothetical protein [Arthrobacter glacialis]|uniref:Uncharacterized protein n=1 Tax=Arthrobacter glacialis TaxID=1664 RepID=A0A2S3ZSG5_ARTGL|nr:hypothetical protein [Arthrobacter glacialis]POH72150.1 hypothetical protein CVS27_16785 [Arthrobacter glacialis]